METTTEFVTCLPRWRTVPKSDYSLGGNVTTFAEQFCRTQKGSFAGTAGDLIRLRPFQKDLLTDLYECDEAGTTRFRTGLVGLPKKNGKSMLGSIIAIHGLVGQGVQGAEVYSVAAAKDQAKIVFEEAKKMIEADPLLNKACKVYRNAIEFPETGSVYRVLSADADLQDGLNPSLVIFDEVHRQPNGDLWTVFTNAISTRPNALVLGITTAGYDRESLCYRLYEYGTKVCNGEIDDPSFFFRWWEPADKEADYRDHAVWQECNPGCGDFQSLDDFERASLQTPESEFRRYRLNQWTSTYSAWLKFGAWDACLKGDYTIPDNASVVLGFDGSWSNDSTALVAVEVGSLHVTVLEAWEKPLEQDEWRVPVSEVEDAIRTACRRFSVKEVACDPSYWKSTLQTLTAEGLPMVEFPNSRARMMEATKIFETHVYEKSLSHDGDAALARHINNCVTKTDRNSDGRFITKEYSGSKRKIDLAVASVMALSRAVLHQDTKTKPAIFWLDDSEEYGDDF